jgi:protein gp37
MSKNSNIEWTDDSWNPATGCTKITKGCKNCYMFQGVKWLNGMSNVRYLNGATPTMHFDLVDAPRHWKKPRKVFVCSMSDLFHDEYTDEFIQSVFKTMNETPQHTYRVLTKRANRLAEMSPELEWTDNIFPGVSIENREVYDRLDYLREVPSDNRWLSIEPLLESVADIDLNDIAWVVLGGESGPNARDMDVEWVREIKDKCIDEEILLFFKQYGKNENNPNMFDDTMKKSIKGIKNALYAKGGCVLDGEIYREFPEDKSIDNNEIKIGVNNE